MLSNAMQPLCWQMILMQIDLLQQKSFPLESGSSSLGISLVLSLLTMFGSGTAPKVQTVPFSYLPLPGQACGMLASAVSSKMLQAMGTKEGFHFEETLTGFKWLGNRAITLEQNQTAKIIFAYEEAIGFMVEDIVRDKDGISAMMTFVELASQLAQNSCSVYHHLLGLYARYGPPSLTVDFQIWLVCQCQLILHLP